MKFSKGHNICRGGALHQLWCLPSMRLSFKWPVIGLYKTKHYAGEDLNGLVSLSHAERSQFPVSWKQNTLHETAL